MSKTMKRSDATNSGTYQAVPLYYGDDNSVCDLKTFDSGAQSSVFHPPFAVPESLLHNLSKLAGKNLSDQKQDANGHVGSKKRRQESATDRHVSYSSNPQEQSEGLPCDLQRKEKFKMTIGAAKNDTHDKPQIPGRQSKLSSDEVAAIILAATRGSSPVNTNQSPTATRHSGASADEAAAIVLAATRGLSPAYADQLPATLKQHGGITDGAAAMKRDLSPVRQSVVNTDEAAGVVLAESRGSSPINSLKSMPIEGLDRGQALSTGSFSSLDGHNPPVVSSVASGKLDTDTSAKAGHVLIARVVANTLSLAASNEANSSEACLTKEEKLKAQRLKRAKLFVAAVKGGTSAVTNFVRSGSVPSGSAEISNTDSIDKESKVPCDSEISEQVKFQDKDNRDTRSRKTYRSRSIDHGDDWDVDLTTTRKKHRTQDSPHRSSEKYREKDRRHHKQHRPSEDEGKHRKESSYRRRHRDDSSENDDDRGKRSDIHQSRSEKQLVIQDENSPLRTSNDTVQLPDATAAPSDLRAKIRAMLLETM